MLQMMLLLPLLLLLLQQLQDDGCQMRWRLRERLVAFASITHTLPTGTTTPSGLLPPLQSLSRSLQPR
jgi:hypothetical protein